MSHTLPTKRTADKGVMEAEKSSSAHTVFRWRERLERGVGGRGGGFSALCRTHIDRYTYRAN